MSAATSHYTTERWYHLLTQAVETDPRGRAGVAERLGFSRSAISQVMVGVYAANPAKVAAAVLEHYDRIDCPHLGQPMSPRQCAAYATRPCPTTSPREVRHWRACRTCPHKPTE